jgi:hypothetical protein
MARERRFAWQLAALCAVAAAVRALLLREYLAENPFAWLPYSDGELYWSRAGEMAAGSWLPDTPFLIAPLYPYLLGALRWLGGGLVALYAVQLALHLATGVLVGAAARIRFGERVGLVGAGLFLLLAEPALFATRVLSPTLQLLLVALLWWDWARLAEAPGYSPRHALRVAAWLGLLALAFPAALLLGPVYAGWLAARAPSPREALLRAALGAGATLLVIAPATLHNATRSGALIPITAHAGITLAQGNDPASIGIYTPLAGLSRSIHRQHRTATPLGSTSGRSAVPGPGARWTPTSGAGSSGGGTPTPGRPPRSSPPSCAGSPRRAATTTWRSSPWSGSMASGAAPGWCPWRSRGCWA